MPSKAEKLPLKGRNTPTPHPGITAEEICREMGAQTLQRKEGIKPWYPASSQRAPFQEFMRKNQSSVALFCAGSDSLKPSYQIEPLRWDWWRKPKIWTMTGSVPDSIPWHRFIHWCRGHSCLVMQKFLTWACRNSGYLLGYTATWLGLWWTRFRNGTSNATVRLMRSTQIPLEVLLSVSLCLISLQKEVHISPLPAWIRGSWK